MCNKHNGNNVKYMTLGPRDIIFYHFNLINTNLTIITETVYKIYVDILFLL